jgi:general secretion pathway protein G
MARTMPIGKGIMVGQAIRLPLLAGLAAARGVRRAAVGWRIACPTKRRRRGFTFVEMMVVITIIVILISMAIPIYQKSIIRSREAVLKNNLFTLRTVIDNYTYDKEKAPQNLSELVSDGYLKKVPLDPITNSDQWKTVMEDATQAVSQAEPGIFDVHSNSDKISLDGTPYSSW